MVAESIGSVFVDVHARTSGIDDEIDRDLQKAAKDAEQGLDRTGTQFGEKIIKSTSKEIGRRGKDLGQAMERASRNTVVQVQSRFSFSRIRDAIRRAFRRDVGESISDEIRDGLDRASRNSGIFSRIGMGVADAIGAGFNISGRSPLIAVLIPALLALVGVILAAVQAVNALVPVLAIIPGLIAAIGLQVGVVAIAFDGVGKAIQGAFAAKNMTELREALKDLTPAAQDFVRTLLPLEPFFNRLKRVVQENFFKAMGDIITPLLRALGPSFIRGFKSLATSMGGFFRDLAMFFASPTFVKFVNKLFPATARWLGRLGPSLVGFLEGLISMATALMPFMEKFGEILLRNLDHFAYLLGLMARNPETQGWLDRMADTLQLVFDLLFNLGIFLFSFMRTLDTAGGAKLIEELSIALLMLAGFLDTDAGLKAMQALVTLGMVGIQTFTGLVIAIFAVLAAFQYIWDWLTTDGYQAVKTFGEAVAAFGNWFAQWVARIIGWIGGAFQWLQRAIESSWNWIKSSTANFIAFVIRKGVELFNWFKALPGRVLNTLGNFGSLLVNAGRSLIDGLMRGIRDRIQPFLNLINWIVGQIGRIFPGSPAKEGPLSGQGYTLFRGQRMMQDFIRGIEMEIPNLRNATTNATSNITFGANSIQMQFSGPVPDQAQARTTGAAMGTAAANLIAARNTRLAVRTL